MELVYSARGRRSVRNQAMRGNVGIPRMMCAPSSAKSSRCGGIGEHEGPPAAPSARQSINTLETRRLTAHEVAWCHLIARPKTPKDEGRDAEPESRFDDERNQRQRGASCGDARPHS